MQACVVRLVLMVAFDATEALTPCRDGRGYGAILFDRERLRQADPGLFAPAQWGSKAHPVGDGGRGVISPCGRCRQVMLDQHPDICVLVPNDDQIRSISVRELLPYSYAQPDEDPDRFVRFSRRYLDDVLAGRKTRTIRYRDPVPLGLTTFVFEDGEHLGFVTMSGVVDDVRPIRMSDLDSDYQEGLRGHYPDMPADPQLTEVRFHI